MLIIQIQLFLIGSSIKRLKCKYISRFSGCLRGKLAASPLEQILAAPVVQNDVMIMSWVWLWKEMFMA
jgi:hypothetical protein